ncbi:MAG: hypothetical protein H6716_13605 [Polyangiaceae bacterium]|nr:hypothetical protein [Polyangiaceae bacterium]
MADVGYVATVLARWRPLFLPVGSLLYVGSAAALAKDNWSAWAALVLIPLFLVLSWRRTEAPVQGQDDIDPSARRALRAVIWGGSMWAMARTGPAGRAELDAAANLGVGVAAVAALVALARISASGRLLAPAERIAPVKGLLSPPPSTRSLDAAGLVTFLWGIAIALPLSRALTSSGASRLAPLASDYATTTAGIGSLLVLVAAAWRLRVLRRLELGVADRAAGALALATTAFLVAVPAALLDVAPPDRVLPIALLMAAFATTWTATTSEPTSVSKGLRGVLAVMLMGSPVTLLAGVAARQAPQYAGTIVLGSCVLSIAVGLLARAVARPFGPEQSRWLDAIERATERALEPEPQTAIQRTLEALSKTSSMPGNRPELWQIDPPEAISVDIAGYLHSARAEAPASLFELASAEPERTLRAETLRLVQIRKPEVRPLLDWFDSRNAFSATLISEEEGPTGFILLPRGNRTAPMSLEEARAVRNLADRISALMGVAAALSRSQQRELAARAEMGELEAKRAELERALDAEGDVNRRATELLAQALTGVGYSPASRVALDELARLARRTGELTAGALLIQHPRGVDPVPWAARLHLDGPRSGTRFVVIDAARSEFHSPATWSSDTSPCVLALRGTLMVLDAAALPSSIQEDLALRARSGEFLLVLSRGTERENNPLSPRLNRAVEQAQVTLPCLAERAEELRPMLIERLAREGLRQRGEPLGVEPRVVALLIEHSWPGNERELDALVEALVQRAAGSVVTAADLAALDFRPDSLTVASGFSPDQRAAPDLGVSGELGTPLPLPTRRRPGPRRRR